MIPTRLSPHFLTSEIEVTGTGLPNACPSLEAWHRWRVLCCAILEPWRERVGPLRITSGGRSLDVLAAIPGASTTSDHQWEDDGDGGVAVDVIPLHGTSAGAWEVLRDMAASGLPVDQGILYSVRGHVHVGMRILAAPRRSFWVDDRR